MEQLRVKANSDFIKKQKKKLYHDSCRECVDCLDLSTTNADLEELHYHVDFGNTSPQESESGFRSEWSKERDL